MDSGTGDVNIDNNTLYVDNSANSVGIGTASPGNKLSVEKARGATVSIANAAARIGGSDVYTYMGSLSGGSAGSGATKGPPPRWVRYRPHRRSPHGGTGLPQGPPPWPGRPP